MFRKTLLAAAAVIGLAGAAALPTGAEAHGYGHGGFWLGYGIGSLTRCLVFGCGYAQPVYPGYVPQPVPVPQYVPVPVATPVPAAQPGIAQTCGPWWEVISRARRSGRSLTAEEAYAAQYCNF